MDNLDDSENNAKISDSAYSNSCSNSQSRRSHSSKSTRSGSNSSGSSGYGGKPSTAGYDSNNTGQPPEKRLKEKDSKKKSKAKSLKSNLITADAEPQVPGAALEPEKEFKVPNEDMIDVSIRSPLIGSLPEKGAESMEVSSLVRNSRPEETTSDNNQLVKCINVPPIRSNLQQSEYFSCVISMHDGIVMYATSSITPVLGYPKEMWTGRSFLDFVHERDRNVFASQITSGLALPKNSSSIFTPPKAITHVNTSSSIVCRLRRYHGLTSTFLVKNKTNIYKPFQLKLSFKKLNDLDDHCIYLVVQATPFRPAYKTSFEVISKAVPFVIRHAANGNIEFVDPESVPYLGYLPHDLIDINALQLYHPHDLDYLQQLYETTVREGTVPRCSPYRMMAQNGDYIKLETEWSSFINPWSKKLEFIIGKHHVIQGPANPDVFQVPNPTTMFKLSDDDKAKTQCMRDNIVRIMNEVLTKPAELAKQQMSKRCQDIAALMETLIEEAPKPEEELPVELHEFDNSYYERDSEMLGGISPHHDFNDSKSSTDTLLSYNQMNYNDNLQRYFDSHQTYALEEMNTSGDTIYGITDRVDQFGENTSGEEGTSRNTNSISFDSSISLATQDYDTVRLTEALLKKHNVEMEKEMVRLHREHRSFNRSERERAMVKNRMKKKEHFARCNAAFQPTSARLDPNQIKPHGVKRPGMMLEAEASPHKHQCTSLRQQRRWHTTSPPPGQGVDVAPTSTVAAPWQSHCRDNGKSYLLGMGVPQSMSVMNPVSAVTGVVPMYFTPPANPSMPKNTGVSSQQQPPPYGPPSLPCMMYGQAMYGRPFMYAPFNQHYDSHPNFVNPGYSFANSINPLLFTRRNYDEGTKPDAAKAKTGNGGKSWRNRRKNDSIAKYMKLPESGSSSSAENSNLVVAKTPPKKIPESPEAIPEPPKRSESKNSTSNIEEKTDGESSYFSFYSSLFKTESGSGEDSDNKKSDKDAGKARSWGLLTQSELYGLKKPPAAIPKRSMDPPWMDQVTVTSELIYRYQVTNKSLDEVLSSDKEKMKNMEQPSLVNEQLAQLYSDLQLEGVAARLTLEEGITSSSSSEDDNAAKAKQFKVPAAVKNKRERSRLVMIYEEDAPFPPPNDGPCAPSTLFS